MGLCPGFGAWLCHDTALNPQERMTLVIITMSNTYCVYTLHTDTVLSALNFILKNKNVKVSTIIFTYTGRKWGTERLSNVPGAAYLNQWWVIIQGAYSGTHSLNHCVLWPFSSQGRTSFLPIATSSPRGGRKFFLFQRDFVNNHTRFKMSIIWGDNTTLIFPRRNQGRSQAKVTQLVSGRGEFEPRQSCLY